MAESIARNIENIPDLPPAGPGASAEPDGAPEAEKPSGFTEPAESPLRDQNNDGPDGAGGSTFLG